MEFFDKTVGEDSIVYTVEFVKSIKDSKIDYFDYYGEKGWQFGEQLAREGLIDYHALLALRVIGSAALRAENMDEEDEDDLLEDGIYALFERTLLSIGKVALFDRIDCYLDEMEEEDIVFGYHDFLHSLALFFYNVYRDLENHI